MKNQETNCEKKLSRSNTWKTFKNKLKKFGYPVALSTVLLLSSCGAKESEVTKTSKWHDSDVENVAIKNDIITAIPETPEVPVERPAQKIIKLRKNIDELKISDACKETLYLQLNKINFGPRYDLTETENKLTQFEDYLKLVKNGEVKVEETIIKKEAPQTKKEQEKYENLKKFLDATENNPAWQVISRKERADMYWKQSGYGDKYDWPIPAYKIRRKNP